MRGGEDHKATKKQIKRRVNEIVNWMGVGWASEYLAKRMSCGRFTKPDEREKKKKMKPETKSGTSFSF